MLRVQFPGQPAPSCPGPNYIVQDIGVAGGKQGCEDGGAASSDAFAIVQASNFSTLFLLSRQQNPSNSSIEVSDSCAVSLKMLTMGRRGSDVLAGSVPI